MKSYACLVAPVGVTLALASPGVFALPAPFTGTAAQTYFAADDAPADLAVELVRSAHTRVLVAGYGSVSPALAVALRDASRRGVAVCVLLDRARRHERYSGTAFLVGAGIEFASLRRAVPMRQPFVVADDAIALGAPAASPRTRDSLAVPGVFRDVPQLARSYARAFWRFYRVADEREAAH